MPGKNIKREREKKNYTQTYMAKRLGISQGQYSNIETHKTDITINTLNQIASILEIPRWVLFYNAEEEEDFKAFIKIQNKENNLEKSNNEILKEIFKISQFINEISKNKKPIY